MRKFIRNAAVFAGVCLTLAAASGCESLQRKFTRKPKHPEAKPSPVFSFQDYSRTLTPLDRYQKHYMMFDYWNSDLADSLTSGRLNFKRVRRASSGAASEMRTLYELLQGEEAERFKTLLDARMELDREIRGPITPAQVEGIRRRVESQSRDLHREFYWTRVQDVLRSEAGSPENE